jgi:hypothetical protein
MTRWFVIAMLAALAGGSQLGRVGAQQLKALDPIGTYIITTTTQDGQPVRGTMTIVAKGSGYGGTFESTILPPVPVVEVTSGVDRLNVVIDAGDFLVQVRMNRQNDGSLTGYWHQLYPGIAATATIKK